MSKALTARSWLGGLRSTAPWTSAATAAEQRRKLPPGVVGLPVVPKPMGGWRGGLIGFALGLSFASAYGFVYILQEYQSASQAMVASVQELEESTQKVTEAYARVSALEDRMRQLEQRTGTKEELHRRTGDLTRVYDALHEDVFEVKAKLYDMEQDINRLLGQPGSRQSNGRLV